MRGRYVANEYLRVLRKTTLEDLLDTVAVNTDNADDLRDDDVPEAICIERDTLIDRLHEAPDLESARSIIYNFIRLCRRVQRDEEQDHITVTKYILRNIDVIVAAADIYVRGEISGLDPILYELGFEKEPDEGYDSEDRKYVQALLHTIGVFWKDPLDQHMF